MSEAGVVRRQRSRAEVEAALVAEFEASGLRRAAFCQQRYVAVGTLDKYRLRAQSRLHSESFIAEVIAQLQEQVASQKKELEYAWLKIQVLEERLRLQRIEKYGPSSEMLGNLQLELLEQEPGVSREEVVAESERKASPPVTKQKKRKHDGF